MLFISKKYKSLRIVLDPKSYQIAGGKRVITGLAGNFPIGKAVEFNDHKFETEDQKVIKALKECPQYGLDFYALEADEKGTAKEVKLSDAALRKLNDKKNVAREVADTDPKKDEDQD